MISTDDVAAITSSMESAGNSILGNFTAVLPAVAKIIAIGFIIGFICYWLKKIKKTK